MAVVSSPWASLWTPLSDDNLLGWVATFEEAEKVRKAFQVEKCLSFVCRRNPSTSQSYTDIRSQIIRKTIRLRFCDVNDAVVPYDGVPFVILSRYERTCLFGKDSHKAQKKKTQQDRERQILEDHLRPPKRKMPQTSKKKGCPARMIMVHVMRFPDFQITCQTERMKRDGSEKLRVALGKHQAVRSEERVYVALPSDEAHKQTHYLGKLSGFKNPLSKEVRLKIRELVGQGVTNVEEMQRHVIVYVESVLFAGSNLPSTTDAAYYPKKETIRKHMYMACQKLSNHSRMDRREKDWSQPKDWKDVKLYTCVTCKETFVYRRSLEKHMTAAKHAPSVRYHCSRCDRKYSRRDSLRSHYHKQHPSQVDEVSEISAETSQERGEWLNKPPAKTKSRSRCPIPLTPERMQDEDAPVVSLSPGSASLVERCLNDQAHVEVRGGKPGGMIQIASDLQQSSEEEVDEDEGVARTPEAPAAPINLVRAVGGSTLKYREGDGQQMVCSSNAGLAGSTSVPPASARVFSLSGDDGSRHASPATTAELERMMTGKVRRVKEVKRKSYFQDGVKVSEEIIERIYDVEFKADFVFQ